MSTVETGLMGRKMVKAHMCLRKLAKSMLVSSCRVKWFKANGFIPMEPASKEDLITTSQRVMANGHLKMAIKFLELIVKQE